MEVERMTKREREYRALQKRLQEHYRDDFAAKSLGFSVLAKAISDAASDGRPVSRDVVHKIVTDKQRMTSHIGRYNQMLAEYFDRLDREKEVKKTARHLELVGGGKTGTEPPAIGMRYVKTHMTANICRVVNSAFRYPGIGRIGVVAVPAGCGKSTTLEHEYGDSGAARVVQVNPYTVRQNFVGQVAEAIGGTLVGNHAAVVGEVVRSLKDTPRRLIFDDAHYLKAQAVALVTYLYDQTGRHGNRFALVGQPSLAVNLDRGATSRGAAGVDDWLRVNTRAMRGVFAPEYTPEELATLYPEYWRRLDKGGRAVALAQANNPMHGCLRYLESAMVNAWRFADANDAEKITGDMLVDLGSINLS